MRFFQMVSILIVSFVASFALAQQASDDQINQQAVADTQKLLRDQTATNTLLDKDPNGAKVQANVKAATANRSISSQEINDVAADIFPDLVKRANGDPEKMRQILEEAQRNPSAFADTLSDANKKKISDMSNRQGSNMKDPE